MINDILFCLSGIKQNVMNLNLEDSSTIQK